MTAAMAVAKATSIRRARTRPQFNQLEIFLKVVETRSFAAAARQTGRTQPAVSQAIARLEEIYGGDLFERRRGAPLSLTPIGEAILPSARILLDTVDQQMVRAAQTAQSRRGSLTIGFHPGLVSGPLRAGIADFTAASPDVRLRLVEGLPGDLHRQLNERAIDLMIVALMPDLASTTLVQEKLWEERLVAALHRDHPLAAKPALDWRDVGSLPLILRASQAELAGYRAILARVGNRRLDCEQHDVSSHTLFDMVAMGIGATIMLESAIVPRPCVALRPIQGDEAAANVDAVWPRADQNPLRHHLLRHIRRHAEKHASFEPIQAAPASPSAPSLG